MLFTVSSQGHKPENITHPPTHTNTSLLLIAFPAQEVMNHPGPLNCVRPKIPKPTQDVCNPRTFSAWDFWRGGGGRTFDLGMFLGGQAYPLAAYATALTHSLQPICQDASYPWHSSGTWGGCKGHLGFCYLWIVGPGKKKHHRGCKINLEVVCTHQG